MKKVAIITYGSPAAKFYKNQVKNLFEDMVECVTYSNEENNFKDIKDADVYLVTTDAFSSHENMLMYLKDGGKVVNIGVDLTLENIKELLNLPSGTKAMLVNMSKVMAIEVIIRISQLGITHIDFSPVYPDVDVIPDIDLAVSVGESHLVPVRAKQVIDIGHRYIDTNTIVELALKLDLEKVLDEPKCKEYFRLLAKRNYSIDTLFGRSNRLETQLDYILNSLDEGIMVFDEKDNLLAYNNRALEIISEEKISELKLEGATALEYIDIKNSDYTGSNPGVVTIKGVYISYSVNKINKNNNCLGIMVKFNELMKEEQKVQEARLQTLNKGYTAKYSFADIIGNSPNIVEAKTIAKKLATTNGAILLTGESGTGKELFAHAIHKESKRNNKPFVAINCAAMPDNLLESELFGYDEGAFTGAKKGGKQGLFEFAHGGTLFLDEIEGMSPSLQLKLLRVLQEKEVMRLGGGRIIIVDVRIIAATNESLEDMVNRGSFRKDLFYRINTLPIDIPPLRERGEDVLLLLEDIKKSLGSKFVIQDQVKDVFLNHKWEGNVRELRNYIEYLSYIGYENIGIGELPPALRKKASLKDIHIKKSKEDILEPKMHKILILLEKANSKGEKIGRSVISKELSKDGLQISEQEARGVLLKLKAKGLIDIEKGRAGTKINEQGLLYLKANG